MLRPDIDDGTFNGTVRVTINVEKFTDEVVLHSKNLTIISTSIDYEDDTAHWENPADEVIVVRRKDNQTIFPGEHSIYVEFHGTLQHDSGLLKVPYFYEDRMR